MKTLKRKLSLLLALVCALSLLSCGTKDIPVTTDTAKTAETTDTAETTETAAGRYVLLEGADIGKYTVVIPADCDLYTEYAADVFVDYIESAVGTTLSIIRDNAAGDTDYRILVGDTAFTPDTAKSSSLSDGEYILMKSGNDIVCCGYKCYVGGGLSEIAGKIPEGEENFLAEISGIKTDAVKKKFEFTEAKSAILLIGDGMGFYTIDMVLPVIGSFAGDDMPNKGESITSSLTTIDTGDTATDSAAGGTAIATGYKTYNKFIGYNGDNQPVKNVRELAAEKGARTGVLTTDVITGATPCCFIAHHTSRDDTDILQEQIDKVIAEGKIDVCEGGLGDNLTEKSAEALNKLSSGGSQFFIMIEEAQIDKCSEANDMEGCIEKVGRFSDLISYCMEFTIIHPDTVLIVTADHETGGIKKHSNGTFEYTRTTHSTANVPLISMGWGTECFNGRDNQNVEIAKFIARIFGEENFGSAEEY